MGWLGSSQNWYVEILTSSALNMTLFGSEVTAYVISEYEVPLECGGGVCLI